MPIRTLRLVIALWIVGAAGLAQATPVLTTVGRASDRHDDDGCAVSVRSVSDTGVVMGGGNCSNGTIVYLYRSGPEASLAFEFGFTHPNDEVIATLISVDGTIVLGRRWDEGLQDFLDWQWEFSAETGFLLANGPRDAAGQAAFDERIPFVPTPPELLDGDAVAAVFGLDTGGFTLGPTRAISQDGNVIAGIGVGMAYIDGFGATRNYQRIWTIQGVAIPEPGTLVLLATTALAAAGRRAIRAAGPPGAVTSG